MLAYHAGVSHVTGGFLGVDAFFVLSGFLITSLLLGEARHTATIRLGAFWARRARRLLPALLLVLCFVGLFAWLGRARGGRIRGCGSTRLRRCCTSRTGTSSSRAKLLPQFARTIPLLHTWSLAIEEQFYLVWPGGPCCSSSSPHAAVRLLVLAVRAAPSRPLR